MAYICCVYCASVLCCNLYLWIIVAVVAALEAHGKFSAAVAEYASGALFNIAHIPAGKEACVAAGAVPLLAATFSAHAGIARQRAHSALIILGYNDSGSWAGGGAGSDADSGAGLWAVIGAGSDADSGAAGGGSGASSGSDAS